MDVKYTDKRTYKQCCPVCSACPHNGIYTELLARRSQDSGKFGACSQEEPGNDNRDFSSLCSRDVIYGTPNSLVYNTFNKISQTIASWHYLTPCLKMYKFTIMTPVRRIIIMCLGLNQDLAKSTCDTTVLLFGTTYCPVVSLLMPVMQFFPKNLKCAIIEGTLWRITFLEYLYDIDYSLC